MSLPLDTLYEKTVQWWAWLTQLATPEGPRNWGRGWDWRQAGRDYQKIGPCAGCSLLAPSTWESSISFNAHLCPVGFPRGGWAARAAPASCGVWSRGGISRDWGGKREKVRVFIPPWQDQSCQLQIFQAMVTQYLPALQSWGITGFLILWVLGCYSITSCFFFFFLLVSFIIFVHTSVDQVIKATITKFFFSKPFWWCHFLCPWPWIKQLWTVLGQ